MSKLLVAALVLAIAVTGASAAATDVYTPVCDDFPFSNTPASAWKKWSSPSTWPDGQVPGVNPNKGVTAVISCDQRVILDVTNITLDILVINGWLKVQDKGPIQVLANYVLNQGLFSIGTPQAPYEGKIIFNMTGANYQLNITRPPATVQDPRSLGYRAFATVGGQLQFNGMYGNQLGWTKLAKTAPVGAMQITVKGDVSKWPVGGKIAIASTDFDRKQAENFTITAVAAGAGGTTVLSLDSPLYYMHWGDPIDTGVGVMMDEAAEVALLTRSIVIQGHPNPQDALIGAHFIVFQTQLPQYIRGVELVNMGQQGSIGRYPMHFHLCQDVSGSLVQDVAVHDSNQRCYVVHGSWNLRLEGNLAFNTKGHCYMTEDGIEFGNQFIRNLGFSTEPPMRGLQPTDPKPAVQSDSATSTFWISNPNNTFIGNIAAGCFDSGFWFQLESGVLGPSSTYAFAGAVAPKFLPNSGVFENNVAHSNGRAGLRTYPSGYRPRLNGGVSNDQRVSGINAPNEHVVFKNFYGWKNDFIGMFVHESDSIIIDGAMIADNAVVGIELDRDEGITIQNSYFMGETENIGNPSQCDMKGNTYANCKPLVGCGVNPSPANARSNGITRILGPQFGINIDQQDYPSHGLTGVGTTAPVPHSVKNCTFSKFNNECRPSAGITANGKQQNIWNSGHSSSGLVFPDASPRIYFAPQKEGILGFEGAADAGPTSQMYVWWDKDGSLVGAKGGYALTNNPTLLPLDSACTAHISDWNGYACPGTCYRSVGISTPGSYSGNAVTITRVKDGASFKLNLNGGTTFANLLAGQTYSLDFGATAVSSIQITYGDGGMGCLDGVVLQFAPPSSTSRWTVLPSANVFWQACSGAKFTTDGLCQVSLQCNGGTSVVQVNMGASALGTVKLNQIVGPSDCSLMQCGAALPGFYWQYDDTGGVVTSTDFAQPSFVVPSFYKTGRAQFGYGGQGEVTSISRSSQSSTAWYFRQVFTVGAASCFEQLIMGVLVDDGVIVYINGQEVYRNNMPGGPANSKTTANSDTSGNTPWVVVALNPALFTLRTGDNVIAAEVHSAQSWSWEIRFDLYITATGSSCSPGDFYGNGGPPVQRPSGPPPPNANGPPAPPTPTSSPPPPAPVLKSPPPPAPVVASPPPPAPVVASPPPPVKATSPPPPKKKSPPPPKTKSPPPPKKKSPPPPKKKSPPPPVQPLPTVKKSPPPPKKKSPPPPKKKSPPPPKKKSPPPPPPAVKRTNTKQSVPPAPRGAIVRGE